MSKPKRITAAATKDMNEDAAEAFRKLSADVAKLGRDPADYDLVLRMAADSWADFVDASRHVNNAKHRTMVVKNNGDWQRNPATAIKKEAKASMLACLEALGFTAKQRADLLKAADGIVNQHGDDVA